MRLLVLGGDRAVARRRLRGRRLAQNQQTPKGWNYEIKDGKRVPKGNRVTNPDGSWREEVKPGQLRDRQGKVGNRRV